MFLGTRIRNIDIEELDRDDTVAAKHQKLTQKQLQGNRVVARRPDGSIAKARGEAVFHGAFTGGFTAGYFNSVDTKEGFKPQKFSSSRRGAGRGAAGGDDVEGGAIGSSSSTAAPNRFQQRTVSDLLDDDDIASGIRASDFRSAGSAGASRDASELRSPRDAGVGNKIEESEKSENVLKTNRDVTRVKLKKKPPKKKELQELAEKARRSKFVPSDEKQLEIFFRNLKNDCKGLGYRGELDRNLATGSLERFDNAGDGGPAALEDFRAKNRLAVITAEESTRALPWDKEGFGQNGRGKGKGKKGRSNYVGLQRSAVLEMNPTVGLGEDDDDGNIYDDGGGYLPRGAALALEDQHEHEGFPGSRGPRGMREGDRRFGKGGQETDFGRRHVLRDDGDTIFDAAQKDRRDHVDDRRGGQKALKGSGKWGAWRRGDEGRPTHSSRGGSRTAARGGAEQFEADEVLRQEQQQPSRVPDEYVDGGLLDFDRQEEPPAGADDARLRDQKLPEVPRDFDPYKERMASLQSSSAVPEHPVVVALRALQLSSKAAVGTGGADVNLSDRQRLFAGGAEKTRRATEEMKMSGEPTNPPPHAPAQTLAQNSDAMVARMRAMFSSSSNTVQFRKAAVGLEGTSAERQAEVSSFGAQATTAPNQLVQQQPPLAHPLHNFGLRDPRADGTAGSEVGGALFSVSGPGGLLPGHAEENAQQQNARRQELQLRQMTDAAMEATRKEFRFTRFVSIMENRYKPPPTSRTATSDVLLGPAPAPVLLGEDQPLDPGDLLKRERYTEEEIARYTHVYEQGAGRRGPRFAYNWRPERALLELFGGRLADPWAGSSGRGGGSSGAVFVDNRPESEKKREKGPSTLTQNLLGPLGGAVTRPGAKLRLRTS
eukprot:g1830.t1